MVNISLFSESKQKRSLFLQQNYWGVSILCFFFQFKMITRNMIAYRRELNDQNAMDAWYLIQLRGSSRTPVESHCILIARAIVK